MKRLRQVSLVMARHRLPLLILIASFLLGSAGSTAASRPLDRASMPQTTVTLTPVSDASIESSSPDANAGGAPSLAVYYGGENETARALIRFNLAAGVPPEAIIDSARLDLHQQPGESTGVIVMTAALVTEDWIEAEVTWNNRPATGDPVVGEPLDADAGYKSLYVTEIVQAWHNVPHFGLELSGPEGETGYDRSFESREPGEHPPQLVVTYHLPPPAEHVFSGYVYKGRPPNTDTPAEGVTVLLYGAEDPWPGEGPKTLLAETVSGGVGEFTLLWEGTSYPYFHIVEIDPAGTYSSGSEAEPPGYAEDLHVVSYHMVESGAYDGIKFWDLYLREDCEELLSNGDLESGSLPPWGSDGEAGLGPGHHSAHGLWLGGADSVTGEVWQAVNIPAGTTMARLLFTWKAESEIEQPGDALEVIVQYGEQADALRSLPAVDPLGRWQFESVDLTAYAGQEVFVTFLAHTDGEVPSTFRVDDVRLRACGLVLPDLILTDVWSEGALICYQILNGGNAVALSGHQTALWVDGVPKAADLVAEDLAPEARWVGCFDQEWQCTPPQDGISVLADSGEAVAEWDEINNGWEEMWPCDVSPPQIVSGPSDLEVTKNSAVIYWQTDEACDSRVRYGSVAGQFPLEAHDLALVTEHFVTLPDPEADLAPSTTYHYLVQSTDPSGNSVESGEATFETLAQADGEDPIVSLVDPGTCRDVVTVHATATDNRGVERVEFFVGDDIVYTDYAPSSPDWEFPWDTRTLANAEFTLKAKAYDLSGRSSESTLPVVVDNLRDHTSPSVIVTSPGPGAVVAGEIPVEASVTDDKGLIEAFFFVDDFGTQIRGYHPWKYPWPTDTTVSFLWNTKFLNDGMHTVGIEAWDVDKKDTMGTVTVDVQNGPGKSWPLVITKHTATRHQNSFVVSLEVKNQGSASITDIEIEDFMYGFQPIAVKGVPLDLEATFHPWGLDPANGEGSLAISDSTPLLPGASRTYNYNVVPVLLDPMPSKPSIGHSVRLYYQVQGGKYYKLEFMNMVGKTTGGVSLPTAYDTALKTADYLLVTNPVKLLQLTPGKAEDVNWLLSDMALLAGYKSGVLGYLVSDKVKLDNLIGAKGSWSAALHANFRKALKGYLLIVGETEVFPAWDIPGFKIEFSGGDKVNVVHLSDQPYSDSNGNGVPDLIVGRIIGNNTADLRTAIQTSIKVHQGAPGYSFDRSHALVISGTDGGSPSLESAFVDNAKTVKSRLTSRGSTVDVIHWSDSKYTTNHDRFQAFKNSAPNKDVIFWTGHGLDWGWEPGLAASDLPGMGFGTANPVVYAASCSTGSYEVKGSSFMGIAEAFLERRAAVYVGSTELSGVYDSISASEHFFSEWGASKTVGMAHTSVEKDAVLLHKKASAKHWWTFWATEYNIYGDPKYGAVSSSRLSEGTAALSTAPGELASELDVVVPNYEVSTSGETDRVRIPGGLMMLEEGEPQVPLYSVAVDYPPGTEIQDVVMIGRTGLMTDTGLNLPLTRRVPASSSAGSHPFLPTEGEGWYPHEEYDWQAVENPDGSTTLVVAIYPFYYNSSTTDVRFYTDYSFEIGHTASPVAITGLSIDGDVYEPGDSVAIDLELENGAEAQDVRVSAVVRHYGSGEMVDGLLVRTLHNVQGAASFATQWDTGGFEPGYYSVEATLHDTSGALLDVETQVFRLGIASGGITAFTASPAQFEIGDEIDISLVFRNTGTIGLPGTIVIRVLDDVGEPVQVFQHEIAGLVPGAAIGFDEVWDTVGAAEGTYSIVGQVLYDSAATEPRSAVVSTTSRVYLPIVLKGYP